jgi:hypothetical protein
LSEQSIISTHNINILQAKNTTEKQFHYQNAELQVGSGFIFVRLGPGPDYPEASCGFPP